MATRVHSGITAFLAHVNAQVVAAVHDAGEEAARRPGAPSDTRGEMTGPGVGRIISTRPYAKAQERGAFIRPRAKRALRYASGRFSMRSRIPAKRYLEQTGRRWRSILIPRLRGA